MSFSSNARAISAPTSIQRRASRSSTAPSLCATAMRRREEEPKMATTETQTVEFSLTEDDYVAYSQLVATRSWHKWLMYGVGGFLLLSAGLNVMNDLYVPGA